jgi:hypothetical protein
VSSSGRGSRGRSSNRGGARGRGRGGRGGRAGRSTGPPLPPSGNYINLDEEHAWEEEEEDLGSFTGPLVSNGSRANWSDRNNCYLLNLCLDQVRAGQYNGLQMSASNEC